MAYLGWCGGNNSLVPGPETGKDTVQIELVNNCYLCEGRGEELYPNLQDLVSGMSGIWGLKKCDGCRIVWLVNRPTRDTIGEAYKSYHTHSPNTSRVGKTRDRLQEVYLSKLLGLKKGPKGTLLDVGCGNGDFLNLARKWGWSVEGVEPDESSARLARSRYGLKVWSDCPTEEDHYDIVVLFHVLEHLHDPIGSLQSLYKLLKRGGRLVILTPNTESLGHMMFGRNWRGLEPPRHLYLFSLKSIWAVVEQSGFRILKLRTSCRLATNIYAASKLIERKGYYERGDIGISLLFRGILFQAYEEAIGILQPHTGEELVLIGTKD